MKPLLLVLCSLIAGSASANLTVATTHPLLSDLARQMGGKTVTVVDLVKPGTELHHFEPTSAEFSALRKAQLLLASGKHMESYLDKLKESLGSGMTILEVGKTIPSLKIEPGSGVFMCCPEHAAGGIDPHWWHSAENMARAAKIIADQFAKMDADNAAVYQANGSAVAKKMLDLKKWAQQEISVIPKDARKLVIRYNRIVEPTAESLWLGLRVERKLGERGAETSYANQLRRRFAASREYQQLQRGEYD